MVTRGAHNSGSHENMDIIKAWMEHCVDGHSDCAFVRTTGRLPTRLLQIEKSGKSFKVKLRLSSALSPYTSYATLSHVWGSGSPMKLVNKSLVQYQNDIPMASLPQTFANAIQLTNSLGLSYLWIDSLCIIQDSALDWELESTTMCDVYRDSTINIAASASVGCDGGLFRQRDPLSVTPCTIPASKQEEAGLGKRGPYALFCEIALLYDPLEAEPLSGRAWAVQERILAPRTVFFTARKIYFVCRKKITTDVDPCSFDGYNGVSENRVNIWARVRPVLAMTASDLRFCAQTWQKVVMQYTRGQLSHESDKLVAIAGLAEDMQRNCLAPEIDYLAGIWSFELIDGLMWRRSSDLTSLTRPKAYRAPSWSWASVQGEVYYHLKKDLVALTKPLYRASIVEARTSPISNSFGSVHGGYIHICGHFCIWTDAARILPIFDVVSVNDRHDREQILAESDGLMFFVLNVDDPKVSTGYHQVGGLILQFTRDKKGQYRRIGFFDAYAADFLPICRSPIPAEHLFMEVNGYNEYTIEII